MKIHGTEGMSAENIRDEVNRGGRLIIYMYCVSILVMTFKRSAGIRLIKGGHSTTTAGLPYTFISLFFGWWGFPWGPIYTIETIYKNLGGGIDVTDEVLQAILPATASVPSRIAASPAPGLPPPIPSRAPAAPPALHAAPPAPRQNNARPAIIMVASAALIIFLGLSGYCYLQSQHLKVVLVSGIDQPYSVTLNGQDYRLGRQGFTILDLPEGDFTLQDAKGGQIVGAQRSYHFAEAFFDHLGTAHVAVINPDRSALLIQETVTYYSEKITPPANEQSPYSLLANQDSYYLAKPDHLWESAPQNISMPSGTTRLDKSRLSHLTKADPERQLELVKDKLGYPAAQAHLALLAVRRADEALLTAALKTLKPADLPAFFQTRLGERPVLVNWHRYYQNTIESLGLPPDLPGEYRALSEAEPGNGAFLYLLGRVTRDRAAAQKLYRAALSAPAPCPHAHGAIGYDLLCNGDFTAALEEFAAAESAGAATQSHAGYRRQASWGLHQYPQILAEIRKLRQADPTDLELTTEEIRATLADGQSVAAADLVATNYLKTMKKSGADAAHLADYDHYLHAAIDYQSNQLDAYRGHIAHFDYPYYHFAGSLTQGNLEAASQVILAKEEPAATELLLLYLLARRTGDEPGAEKYFTQALERMSTGSKGLKQAATLYAANAGTTAQDICDLALACDDKCVLLTALGVRDPAHQGLYHPLAEKLNFMPEFPQHFLRSFLTPAQR